MVGKVFLEGEDIDLKTVEEEDLEFLRDGVNHPGVRVFMDNKMPQNLSNQKEFFEESVCSEEDASFLICTKDDKRAGIISLTRKGDRADKMAEIGLWIHPDHHGNGYGTEASKLLTEYGFKQLNYHKIYARAFENNKPSQKVWEKLSFTTEGVLRDHVYTQGKHRNVVYYGVLQGEWE